LGMFTAATAIKKQLLPVDYLYNRTSALNGLKNILIYNHFQNKDHSLILLSSC